MTDVQGLVPHFLRATEAAAIASADWRGRGDGKAADAAAVKAMRDVFDTVPFDGRVAIGEGERDEAPMLWIGEPLGHKQGEVGAPAYDIAVDPLECTNNCALNAPNSITVLAAGPRGTLLHAPDCYMDKLAGVPALKGVISLKNSIKENIEATAQALDKPVEEVRVIALDRERHLQLFAELRELGVRLTLIPDGDVSAAIWAADPKGPFDLLMGIGAAPEGVISAAAIRGMGGVFEGKLVFRNDEERERATKMVEGDLERILSAKELCMSDDSVFVATGVCDGYLPGVEVGETEIVTHSQILDVKTGVKRYITSVTPA